MARASPYTKELLESILTEGSAKIVGNYGNKFNQRMRIEFLCKCGTKVSKRFEMLNVHRMPYCKECMLKIKAENYKITCIEKYGVENAAMTKESKDKQQKIYLEKYGGHPKSTKEVQEKWIKTCLEKYGGHPNQNKEVQERHEINSYKFKEYITPFGNTIKYQGYENLALNELFEMGYKEEDIIIGRSKVPIIKYLVGEVKHVYFPDIYLRSENKIIEIKSEWTITLKRANIVEKAQATIKEGFLYEIWIYDTNKNKVNEILCNEFL